jgi:protein required for attachment to host cells
MKQEIIWIAVADSHDVKIFQTIKNKPVCPIDIRDGDPRKAGRDSCRVSVSRRDKGQNKKGEPQLIKEIKFESEPNDKPGRTFDSFGSGRHAIEPHTDIKDVERQHFAHEISHFLCESVNCDQYDELILIAPHKMLNFLFEALDKKTQLKVSHKVHKNITEFHPHDLRKYLSDKAEIQI